jgi:alanine racemase
MMAVLKANAYGHGAVACARAAASAGVEMIAVALVEEGLELREAGVKTPILVLGGLYEGAEEVMVETDLTPVLFRPDQIEAFALAARAQRTRLDFHLKLDTGMGRIGARVEELPGLLRALADAPELHADGILSHFANADDADQEMNERQLDRFRRALALLSGAGLSPRWRHLSNSAGVLGLPGAHDGELCNLVRPGLVLFGESPAERLREAAPLEPVLTWKTQVLHVKAVKAGTPVSYGGRWCATRDSLIATLPVGYADGYPRKLTNCGEVLIRGQRAPVAGTVCMDACMVDVTQVPGAQRGDEVVLLGRQGSERIGAGELAARAGTIPYEIFTGISARVPRLLAEAGHRG